MNNYIYTVKFNFIKYKSFKKTDLIFIICIATGILMILLNFILISVIEDLECFSLFGIGSIIFTCFF